MDKIKEQNPLFDLNKKIEVALITALYKQAKPSFIASWVCATVVLIYLSYAESPSFILVYAWYTLSMTIILARLFLVNAFLRNKAPEPHLALWRHLFILGSFLGGISWGLIGSPLLLPKDNLQQALIMVILAGVCAGSVPAFSPMRRAALFFLVPALLPLILSFMAKDSFYLFFVLTLSAFFLHLITLVFRTHRIIKDSIQLQFENDALLKDLSAAKNQLELSNLRLKQDATHDPLTHVANRSLFEEMFAKAIETAGKKQTILALLYLDLDKFKEVNDQYGHDAGDQLLLIVVARLKNILREQDIVSRLGGDELTIILEEMEDVQGIADIAERVCHAIREPIMLKEAVVQVYASVGISIYPIDGDNANTLLRIADRAMYYVKDHGGNNYHFNVQVESL
jgi:diguanylate cyclase (GGDEF)-like protein